MAANTDSSKKEEFRRYLEKSGVIDALTKVLVGLYEEPERPTHAVDYLKRHLGASTSSDAESVRKENEELKMQLEEMKKQLDQSKSSTPALAEEKE
mmetsp:Transcript_11766/g.20975  ORF Transcript_11766/g.20975 Transcript_11766/m.20975 type:complete len:96 (-) Transcript_11766:2921-3208(-)